MDLHAIIGQRLVFGFQGPALTESFRQLVRQYKIGNVILFRHNVVDNVQLRALCADIQQRKESFERGLDIGSRLIPYFEFLSKGLNALR